MRAGRAKGLSVMAGALAFASGASGVGVISLSGTSGFVGSSVTINGTNFNAAASSNVVFFGAVRATVASASATQLVVTVPVGATFAPVSVTVPDGLTTYSQVPFSPRFHGLPGLTGNSFAPRVDFPGDSAASIAMGDLDGDGRPEVIVTHDASGVVSIYRNLTTSPGLTTNSFAPAFDLPTLALPFNVALGDIDSDGRLDVIASGNGMPGNVSIFQNQHMGGELSAGSFAARVDLVSTNRCFSVALGDFDGDGHPDIAAGSEGSAFLTVWRNTCSPGVVNTSRFDAPLYLPAEGNLPYSVAIGDLDGDGKPELASSNFSPGRLQVFRNVSVPGTIGFASRQDFAVASGAYRVHIADVDGDGKQELLSAHLNSQWISVLRNSASPGVLDSNSFASPVLFSNGGEAWDFTVGDLDGDGHVELATAGDDDCTMSVLRNEAIAGTVDAGAFAARLGFPVFGCPSAVAVGDLDGDGRPDVAVADMDGAMSIFRNVVPLLCVPPPDGLVAWWPGDGNANDVLGSNHGVLQGDASYAPGLVGGAFSFNGGGQMEIPHSPGLSFAAGTPMTLTLWAYRTAHYLPFHIIGKRDGCGPGFEWNYMIGIDGSVPDTPLNTWIHWALVFTESGANLYTNGSLYVAGYSAGTLGPENTVPLTIGTAGPCLGFTGLIDEVAIFNRALAPNELGDLMAPGSGGMCRPLPLTIGVLGGGGVIRSPDKPLYSIGESVTLTATNRPYYTFLRWNDGPTAASRAINVGAVSNLVAIFTNTVLLEELVFPAWQRSYGGSGTELIAAVEPAPGGGFLLGGSSYSPEDGTKTALLRGEGDFWIARIDDGGDPVWDQSYGGTSNDALAGLTMVAPNRWRLTGSSFSETGPDKTSPAYGENDVWLVDIDDAGAKQSEASFGGEGRDQAVFVRSAGGGGFIGGKSGSPVGGTKTSVNHGGMDFWLVGIGFDGTALWEVSVGGTNHDEIFSGVVPTPDGGVLLAGRSSSDISGNKTSPRFDEYGDAWIVRFGPNGEKLWERSYGGTDYDEIYAATVMPDGGFVLAGATYSGVSGNKTSPAFGDSDAWLLRLDAEGNTIWDQTFGGTNYDYASRVTVTGDGGVLVTGTSDSPVSGNKTAPLVGNVDVWLLRLDPYGNKLWERTLGGTDEEYSGVSVWLNDGFVTGNVSASPPSGNKTSPHYGEYDYWVSRFTTREATVGTPAVLVNGQFSPTNSFLVTNSALVSIQTTFSNGHIFYTLNSSTPGSGRTYSGPFMVNESVTVRALAYNEDYSQSAEADAVAVTVVSAPVITLQPESAVARSGADVLLLVDAAGAMPLTYQWFFEGSPISGATNSFLFRTNVQSASAGGYAAVVSNPYGSATSLVATVTALVPPNIIAQPVTTNASFEQEVTFCVSVIGSGPLSFQWRKNGVNLPGRTNSCFVINSVGRADGGSYTVVVQNGIDAITSEAARLLLNVLAPPTADQFTNATMLATDIQGTVRGTNRLATSEAGEPAHGAGAGGRTVWYKFVAPGASGFTFDTVGSTFDTLLAIYTGTSVDSLTLVARDDDSGGFHTSSVGFTRTVTTNYIAVDGFGEESGEFILHWIADVNLPVIVSQPVSRSVPPGGTATYVVAATNNTPQLQYQWRFNGVDLDGQINAQLVVTNVQAADVGFYSVKVSNFGLGSVVSAPAVLEIGPVATLYSVDRVEEILTQFGGLAPFQPASGSSSVSIGSLGTQILNTTNSTTSFLETNHCGVIGGSSRWFRLQAATNATFALDTDGSGFNTVLAVYTADSQSGGYPTRLVGCNDDAAAGVMWSRVTFRATNGIDYLIVVDGVGGASGPVTLNWWLGNPPVIGPNSPPLQTPLAREGTNLILVTSLTNGIPPPRLQWYRNQTLLGNATNASLILNNVQLANAGTYTIVASNAIGTITSIVARVTIDVPLNLGVITVTEDGRTHIQVRGTASQAFVIQGTTNFANWIPIYTNAAVQPVNFDDRSATNRPRRFYRAVPWP